MEEVVTCKCGYYTWVINDEYIKCSHCKFKVSRDDVDALWVEETNKRIKKKE